jgi:hypothetical protein
MIFKKIISEMLLRKKKKNISFDILKKQLIELGYNHYDYREYFEFSRSDDKYKVYIKSSVIDDKIAFMDGMDDSLEIRIIYNNNYERDSVIEYMSVNNIIEYLLEQGLSTKDKVRAFKIKKINE